MARAYEAQPQWYSNKESWSDYQARHCEWERGYPCKNVPRNQGVPPPKSTGDILLELFTGLLSMGPAPQPEGFNISLFRPNLANGIAKPRPLISAKPIITSKIPTKSSTYAKYENSLSLSGTATNKPKISGRLQRVNGKIGYLLGDERPPFISEEPVSKRSRLEQPDTDNLTKDTIATHSNEAEEATIGELNIINRIEPINEAQISRAKEEIESLYSRITLENNELDIENEIKNYNSSSAHEHVSFREYYALRHYKEIGYLEINEAMRTGNITPELQIEISEVYNALDRNSDMNITLRESDNAPPPEESNVSILYRGETRNRAEFLAKIKPDTTIDIEPFFSTTSDEEVINDFKTDDLQEGQINVSYMIKYHEGLTNSTDISEILGDAEQERIFLPHSRFNIDKVTEVDNGETVEVEMTALVDGPFSYLIPVN
ncbi:Uncharacterised protein [Yersinia aleksiciae]|nr:Uncharacterised protein [Yersinia aleksiciae]CNK50465.1 Uncharacterised protein [Yersinia aleksiciae]